jgi:hypothetical protein
VKACLRAFPQREILIMVDAPTPELVEQAANRLQRALEADPELFLSVANRRAGAFLQRAAVTADCRAQERGGLADACRRPDWDVGRRPQSARNARRLVARPRWRAAQGGRSRRHGSHDDNGR